MFCQFLSIKYTIIKLILKRRNLKDDDDILTSKLSKDEVMKWQTSFENLLRHKCKLNTFDFLISILLNI
jgi:hypothetical protein